MDSASLKRDSGWAPEIAAAALHGRRDQFNRVPNNGERLARGSLSFLRRSASRFFAGAHRKAAKHV